LHEEESKKAEVRRNVEQVEISGEQSVEKKALGCHLQRISCLGANRVILLDFTTCLKTLTLII
jgi:hypothetical protein